MSVLAMHSYQNLLRRMSTDSSPTLISRPSTTGHAISVQRILQICSNAKGPDSYVATNLISKNCEPLSGNSYFVAIDPLHSQVQHMNSEKIARKRGKPGCYRHHNHQTKRAS